MKRILIIILALLLWTVRSEAADIVRLTNADGLSNSSVNTIFQDSSDLMWFGTWDGLNRYNGRDFKVFKPSPESGNSIGNNIIRDIVESEDGIWIATDRGIDKYDRDKKIFTHYFTEKISSAAVREHTFHVAIGPGGAVYAGINGNGIYTYNVEEDTFVPIEGLAGVDFVKMVVDAHGHIWCLTSDNDLMRLFSETVVPNVMNVFSEERVLWMQTYDGKWMSFDTDTGLSSVECILPSGTGKISAHAVSENGHLIGTSSGLYRLNAATKSLETVIEDVAVLSLHYGTQKIIWVGTDNQGVWKITGRNQHFSVYPESGSNLFGNAAVRAFHEDENSDLWVGTKGHGMYVLAKQGEGRTVKRHFSRVNGLSDDAVYVIKDGGDVIWIGTDGRGLDYYDRKSGTVRSLKMRTSTDLKSVYSIFPQNDTLWVGTSGYGMYMLEIDRTTTPYSVIDVKQYSCSSLNPSLTSDVIYSIVPDSDRKLWVGSRGGGLARFDIRNGTFESFRFSADDAHLVSSDDILSLMKDRDGDLWVGTSMGLYKLILGDGSKSSLIRYGEEDGIPNNTIHGILEDSNGSKWISTNYGIAKIVEHEDGVRIESWFKNDGLQDNEFSDGAFYKSSYTGEMFFGGINGFNSFMPLSIESPVYMPELVLDEFFIDNEEVVISDYMRQIRGGQVLVLDHTSNSVTFKFSPVEYLDADKCEIAYMLEGFNKDWVRIGTSNTIVFSNLQPGSYTLKVKCSNAGKKWSEDVHVIRLKVKPSFFASPLAKTIYVLLFLMLCYVVYHMWRYRYEVSQKIRLQEQERRMLEEQTEAKLVFFTNIAHEFSNILTLIYGPCEVLLKDRSISSRNMKYLNIIESNSNRLYSLIQQLIFFRKAETGHLSLKMENVDVCELLRYEADYFLDRFEQKKIHFSIKTDEKSMLWVSDRDSLEKIIFNLISNAVKYTPENENIMISAYREGDSLRMRVTNTGVGISKEKQALIFDRFEVINKFEQDLAKGRVSNGIGLALCRTLVKLLGGRIWIDSDSSTFTTFNIELPLQDVEVVQQQSETGVSVFMEEHPVEMPESEEPASTTKGASILLVDDNVELRKFLRSLLEKEYHVSEASDGNLALEMISKESPDLVICDMTMPKMNGAEFVKIIKGMDHVRHIPVIILSARNTVEDQITGLESGADAYLVKPFHPKYLLVMVDNLLGRNKAIMAYSKSAWSAVEQFNDRIVKKEDKEFITSVTDIICRNIGSDTLSIDMISEETAMGKMTLYRKVKELLDMTPTEYIRHLRLEKAENLLKTTNKTVQEIMFECGFNSKTYFYREFAKKYHLTPKEYAKQFRKI